MRLYMYVIMLYMYMYVHGIVHFCTVIGLVYSQGGFWCTYKYSCTCIYIHSDCTCRLGSNHIMLHNAGRFMPNKVH